MIISAIIVKAIVFCFLSSVNEKVRMAPLTALEAVFVIEIINEVYGCDEDYEDRKYGKD